MRNPVRPYNPKKYKLRFAFLPVTILGYRVWLEFYYKAYYRNSPYEKWIYDGRRFKEDDKNQTYERI